MKIRVRAFAQFRNIVGGDRIVETGDEIGSKGLLRLLAEESPEIRSALFEEGGELRSHVIVMLNGKRVPAGEDRVMGDGDELAVFPPVAGG